MGAKLEVSVVTKGAQKSIKELQETVKRFGSNVGGVSIISKGEQKFIKNELNNEFKKLTSELKAAQRESEKLRKASLGLKKNSQAELKNKQAITVAMKKQAEIAKQMGKVSGMSGGGSGRGRGLLGSFGGMRGMGGIAGLAGMTGVGALAGAAGYGINKGIRSSARYVAGAANRTRLAGLGVSGNNFGSTQDLASAGMNVQDMIQRRATLAASLGKSNATNGTAMSQARFERSYGLQNGTMANSAMSLRGNFGGKGANQAQMKLQASIMASGIEDALAPYLDTATSLLNNINENGMTASTEMIKVFGQLVKNGARTPEQIARAFQTINSGIKGSTGEANAFFQEAFHSMGIGGGMLGATNMAIQSGGLFGLDRGELETREYNPKLIANMKKAGLVDNFDKRSVGILNNLKKRSGMNSNESINSVTDVSQMSMMSGLANSVFGTQGMGGFDAIKLLEKAQQTKMKPSDFKAKLKEIQGKTPQSERLDKINNTLAGQTEHIRRTREILEENLGAKTVGVSNRLVEADNMGTGVVDKFADGVKKFVESINDLGDPKKRKDITNKNKTGKVGFR